MGFIIKVPVDLASADVFVGTWPDHRVTRMSIKRHMLIIHQNVPMRLIKSIMASTPISAQHETHYPDSE
jgi:hypothetical protein